MTNYPEIIQEQTFSVTEAADLLNDILNPLTLTVVGEVSGFNISQSKFVYFNIKDDQSMLSCFMMLFALPFALEDGMKVKIVAQPKIVTKSGRFSLTVKSLELVGEGDLLKAFEQLKQKLDKEGLFLDKWKQPLPLFPIKLGLITSKDGDALQDIMRILSNRAGGLKINLLPVAVQGQNAVTDIVNAVQYFNANYPVDVIIVARGGGSLEDLQAFNSEPVARAVFASKIPIITGVGHEPDVTLIDMVADRRAATPTNAAEIAVIDYDEFGLKLNSIENNLQSAVKRNLVNWGRLLDQQLHRLHRSLVMPLRRVDDLEHRLSNAVKQQIQTANQKIGLMSVRLSGLDPLQVLKRGYSITKIGDKVLTSAKSVKTGDQITSVFVDGRVESKVVSNE
ncbi:MAG: exodeoxyribonuclease VII large subunit [Patescibacteria group bacterium]|jgi:exodeoxyribonuclease VII large subunit